MEKGFNPKILILGLFFALIGSGYASASTVFSQLPIDGGVSFGANLNSQIVDDFTLSRNSSIDSIRWWGGEGFPTTPVSDLFSVRFYDDSSGSPEVSPFLTLTVANPVRNMTELNASPGQSIFEYEAILSQAVPLSGGVTYYLSILSQSYNWGWSASNHSGNSWVRASDGNDWVSRLDPSADLAFELKAVPIPAAVWLLGSGLTGLVAVRRKKKA